MDPLLVKVNQCGEWVEGKMQPTSHDFVARARQSLGEEGLQEALATLDLRVALHQHRKPRRLLAAAAAVCGQFHGQ